MSWIPRAATMSMLPAHRPKRSWAYPTVLSASLRPRRFPPPAGRSAAAAAFSSPTAARPRSAATAAPSSPPRRRSSAASPIRRASPSSAPPAAANVSCGRTSIRIPPLCAALNTALRTQDSKQSTFRSPRRTGIPSAATPILPLSFPAATAYTSPAATRVLASTPCKMPTAIGMPSGRPCRIFSRAAASLPERARARTCSARSASRTPTPMQR